MVELGCDRFIKNRQNPIVSEHKIKDLKIENK
jgi:hypothetical protein